MKKFNKHRESLDLNLSPKGADGKPPEISNIVSLSHVSAIKKIEIMGKAKQAKYGGNNMFNVDAFIENVYNNGVSSLSLYKLDTGMHVGTISYAEQKTPFNFGFEAGKRYTFSFTSKTVNLSTTNASFNARFVYDDGTTSSTSIYLMNTGKVSNHFVTSQEGKNVAYFAFANWGGNGHVEITNLMLNEGVEVMDYEPYTGREPSPSVSYPQPIKVSNNKLKLNVEPKETLIPYLAGIGEYKDILEINYENNFAKKQSKVAIYTLTGDEEIIDKSGAFSAYEIVLPKKAIAHNDSLCTHFRHYSLDDCGRSCFDLVNGNLCLYYVEQNSVEELRAWLKSSQVQIAYAMENAESEIVTEDLYELLKSKSIEGQITIEVENASYVLPEYYTETNYDTRKIKVNFVNENGETIKDSDTRLVRKNSKYKLIPPEIEGYLPQKSEYSDYLSEDREITIIYYRENI